MRQYLLLPLVSIGLMMNCHLAFTQDSNEKIDTLTEISQKIEIPIIVKVLGEKQDDIQGTTISSKYNAYVQKYHYKLKKNPETLLANSQYDEWLVSVENSEWNSNSLSVHGIFVNTEPFPSFSIYYLFVCDAKHLFLAWVENNRIYFKNILESENKSALLENHINHALFVPEVYHFEIQRDLFEEMKNVKIDGMEIIEISYGNNILSLQVKLKGPQSGAIYIYAPDKNKTDEAIKNSKLGKLTPSLIQWKQISIIH